MHLIGLLDPENPRYAPKLAAAVRAWQAVFVLDASSRWIAPRRSNYRDALMGSPSFLDLEEIDRLLSH